MNQSNEEKIITLLSEILTELRKSNLIQYSVNVGDNTYRSGTEEFIKGIKEGFTRI